MKLDQLIQSICQIHDRLAGEAVRAVNVSLTLRNWLIGWHIQEYELKGEDRSQYGDRLFEEVAARLTAQGLSNCRRRQLYHYRDFSQAYPEIVGTLSPQFKGLLPVRALRNKKVRTLSAQLRLPAEKLLHRLSYSHFELLLDADQPLQRAFYEFECMKGQWSVRELKRQMATLLYERTGLSRNKAALLRLAQTNAEPDHPALVLRDPYVFEFLGLKPSEVMRESAFEEALLDKLQEFLLELGRGFCFEARQKRLLLGDEFLFVDLVFYHRLLKCHVLIDLKVDGFKHEYLGQLNTCLNWFREHEMTPGDAAPVGLLLCTAKNHALVRYALAGLDNQLFVSKYLFQLPDETAVKEFLERQLQEAPGATAPPPKPAAGRRRTKPSPKGQPRGRLQNSVAADVSRRKLQGNQRRLTSAATVLKENQQSLRKDTQ